MPVHSTNRLVLVTTAIGDHELRNVDVEEAHLNANINEELCIQILEEYQAIWEAVGKLDNVIYGLAR